MSRTLDQLASLQSGVTLVRDTEQRSITVTGGLLKINTWLDVSSIRPGWRILCKDGGGIAFNAPDRPSTGLSVSPTSMAAGLPNISLSDHDRLVHGEPFTISNLGGYTGPNTTDTYYAGLFEANDARSITLYKSQAAALAMSSVASSYVIFEGAGTAANVVMDFATNTGRIDIGIIGDNDDAGIQIIEDETAYVYGDDNYASNSEISRFESGKIELRNVFWAVDTNEGASRRDFDIYMGDTAGNNIPEVILRNCEIVTDTRFNHFGSSELVIDNFGFHNVNTSAATGAEVEFIVGPASVDDLTLKNTAKGLRFLVFAQPNNTPIVARNITGANNIGCITHVPVGRSGQEVGQIQNKYIHLIDFAGEVARKSGEVNATIRDIRTMNFHFDGVATNTLDNFDVQIKPTTAGYPTVALTNNPTFTLNSMGQASGELLYKDFPHNTATGTSYNTYQLTVNTPNTRRFSTTFTVSASATGSEATITNTLAEDILPDGTLPSTISVPTTCSTLSEVHRAIKSWESTNYDVEPKNASIGYVHNDELRIRSGYDVVLSSTATNLIAIASNTITIKCSATLAASNGLVAIHALGASNTISTAGTVDTSAVWLRDSAGQETKINIINHMGEEVNFSVVKTSDGTKPASTLSIANDATGTISIATKGLGSGYNVVGKRKGYYPFVYEVDLTNGGSYDITAINGLEITQPTGVSSYPGASVVTTGISISDESSGSSPLLHIAIGNTTYTADQIFKRFEDYLATSYGGRYLGLRGDQMIYTSDTIKGDQLYFGNHIKIKRSDEDHSNATVRASLFASDRAPIEDENGDIQTIEGLDIPALAATLITTTDFDPAEEGTQSIWGKLTAIATSVEDNETEIASINSEVSGNSTNLTNVLTKIGENKTAIDNMATDVSSALTKLDANKTVIDEIDTQTEENQTDIESAITKLDTMSIQVNLINSNVTANGTSLTSLTTLVNNIPTSVWDHVLDDAIREDLEFVPVSIGATGTTLHIPSDVRDQLTDGDEIIITDLGGYGGLSVDTSYYVRKSPDFSALFANRTDALSGVGLALGFTDANARGAASNMRMVAKNVVKVGDGQYLMKEVHDTVTASTGGNENLATMLSTLTTNVSNVPASVWGAAFNDDNTYEDMVGAINTGVVNNASSLTSVRTAVGNVAKEVWRHSQRPTSLFSFGVVGYDNAQFVWASPDHARIGDLIDDDEIATGDVIMLASPTLVPESEVLLDTAYYIRLSTSFFQLFTLHATRDDAINDVNRLEIAGNAMTFSDLDLTFTARGTYGTVVRNTALDALVEAHDIVDDQEHGNLHLHDGIESLATAVANIPTEVWESDLDPQLAGTQDIRSAIKKLNTLLGDNFVETDVNLQLAMRLILAVLVGKLEVTNDGGRFRFHRLDTNETAVIESNASVSGRSGITFGNSI